MWQLPCPLSGVRKISGVPGTIPTALGHKGALRTPLGMSMCRGKERRPFPFGEGHSHPRRQRRGKEGSGIISLCLDRLSGQWPGRLLSVGAATWRRHRLWEAGDETGVPPSVLLPGGSQRTVSRGKGEGQLLLGLVEKPGA